jgi:hypothetical protein
MSARITLFSLSESNIVPRPPLWAVGLLLQQWLSFCFTRSNYLAVMERRVIVALEKFVTSSREDIVLALEVAV